MSDRVTHPTNGPRHLYHTGQFKTLPKHLQVRPDMFVNAPRNGGPHLAADSKAGPSVDADPTRKVQALPPHPPIPHPNVTVEPPMTARDARFMQRFCTVALAVVLVAAVAALVARIAGVSW
jgi:hypothetical protein